MKLITRFELTAKSTTEFRSLHKEVFNTLVRSEPLTLERVIAKGDCRTNYRATLL